MFTTGPCLAQGRRAHPFPHAVGRCRQFQTPLASTTVAMVRVRTIGLENSLLCSLWHNDRADGVVPLHDRAKVIFGKGVTSEVRNRSAEAFVDVQALTSPFDFTGGFSPMFFIS